MLKVSWQQALGWRTRRHLLDPIGHPTTSEVVRRLCGVQAQVASSAELAIRLRQEASQAGEVSQALADGDLIKTWAMRGTLHLFDPEDAGAFLSLLAAGRSWERPSWQRAFGIDAAGLERLRGAVGEALEGHSLTREALITQVTAKPDLDHVGEALRSGWGTLLKPLAWQGDLCFGPSQGTRVTFMRPVDASPRWAGVPDPEVAAPRAIAAYLGAYGPATPGHFHDWLSRGRVSVRQLRSWFASLGGRLAEVEIDGESAYMLEEHVDDLAKARPTTTVRLLPAFDQYVLGPGTGDGHVTPAARRAAVSRQSGWISPVVLAGGVVSGTWQVDGATVAIAWFREAGRPPVKALEAEAARFGSIAGRDVGVTVERV